MPWWSLALLAVAGVAVLSLATLWMARWLSRREPYSGFVRLRTRRKLTFVRLMLRDARVPLYVKAVPFLLLLYLSIPLDIIPDFIPVLGYLDDVLLALLALALIMKLTPAPVVQELVQRAGDADAKA